MLSRQKCMDLVLILDNDTIQFVKEAKFLDLIWDSKLTFEPPIKYLKHGVKNPWTSWTSSTFRMGCRSNYIIETISLPG